MKHYIYILIDPETNKIRYVGQTTKNINKRLTSHLSKVRISPNKTTHKNTWIKSLLNKNLKPIIEIIDTVTTDNWKEKEKYYIQEYKKNNDLLNISEGGDSGCYPGHKRIWKSEEDYLNWKTNVTNSNKNKILTDETRKKMAENCRLTHKGKKRSVETKEKLRNSKIGEKNHRFGISLSDERKKQNSLFNKGKVIPDDVRIKIKLNQPNRRSVIQKTKDDKIVKIYNSILEAKRETKLMNIYKVLNGTMNYCGNYKWEYYDKN